MRDRRRLVGAWDGFRQLDEFLRLYQVGFVAVWPLLGFASAQAWTPQAIAGLLAVSVGFNVFGGVLNDICDLDSDRHSRERSDRWLITGVVPVGWAIALVMAQLPLMLVVHLAAGFPLSSFGWLIGAFIGQASYDVCGKRGGIPPLAEAGQAAAASCLVFYGSTSAIGSISALAWPTALAGAAVLLLVNAFHGGLRDIHDDSRSRVLTTPIWLGCAGSATSIRISPAMSAYGTCCFAILVAASVAVASEVGLVTLLVTSVGCAINGALFVSLHRLEKPAWDVMLRIHVATLMIPIMAAFCPLLGVRPSALLFTIYVIPILPLAYRFASTHVLSASERGFSLPVVRLGAPFMRGLSDSAPGKDAGP